MANYEASIRVNTQVDTSQMQKLQIQIDKTTKKVDDLSKKYDELKNKKVSTEAFTTLEGKLKSAKIELDKLIAEENRLADAGLAIGSPWDNVIAKEAEAQLKIENIQEKMQELVETGKAFTIGRNQEELRKAAGDLSMAKAELRALTTKQMELNMEVGKTESGVKNSSEAFAKMGGIGKRILSSLT